MSAVRKNQLVYWVQIEKEFIHANYGKLLYPNFQLQSIVRQIMAYAVRFRRSTGRCYGRHESRRDTWNMWLQCQWICAEASAITSNYNGEPAQSSFVHEMSTMITNWTSSWLQTNAKYEVQVESRQRKATTPTEGGKEIKMCRIVPRQTGHWGQTIWKTGSM